MYMREHLYTEDEVILCTYAAMYSENDFGGINKIKLLQHRSISSIKMKIKNIASMLDENGIKRFTYDSISPLTGLPTGRTGRRTNWEIVSKICKLEKNVFLQKCKEILKKYG